MKDQTKIYNLLRSTQGKKIYIFIFLGGGDFMHKKVNKIGKSTEIINKHMMHYVVHSYKTYDA